MSGGRNWSQRAGLSGSFPIQLFPSQGASPLQAVWGLPPATAVPFTASVSAQCGRFSLTEESGPGGDMTPSCHTARVPVPVDCGEVGQRPSLLGGQGRGQASCSPQLEEETAYGVQDCPLRRGPHSPVTRKGPWGLMTQALRQQWAAATSLRHVTAEAGSPKQLSWGPRFLLLWPHSAWH